MNEEYKHIESDEQEIFLNKKTDKIYVSKVFDTKNPRRTETGDIIEDIIPMRYVSKVLESE